VCQHQRNMKHPMAVLAVAEAVIAQQPYHCLACSKQPPAHQLSAGEHAMTSQQWQGNDQSKQRRWILDHAVSQGLK
jgi:hypothetical protein